MILGGCFITTRKLLMGFYSNNRVLFGFLGLVSVVLCQMVLIELTGLANADGFGKKMPLAELQRGMSIPLVLRVAGPVEEKMEYETSRRERWFYPGARLLFFQGELQDWSEIDAAGSAIPVALKVDTRLPSSQLEGTEAVISPATEEILSEILKEVPSSPDTPSSSLPAPPAVGQPALSNSAPMLHDTGMRRIDPLDFDDED